VKRAFRALSYGLGLSLVAASVAGCATGTSDDQTGGGSDSGLDATTGQPGTGDEGGVNEDATTTNEDAGEDATTSAEDTGTTSNEDTGTGEDSGPDQDSGHSGQDSGTHDSGTDSGSTHDAGTDSGPPTCTVTDCSNPACTTVACVSAIPSGWTGYFALFDGAPATDPSCPNSFPTSAYLGNAGLTAPPDTCSTCSCGAATGGTCTLPLSYTVEDGTCGGTSYCSGTYTLSGSSWNGSCTGNTEFQGGQDTCGVNGGSQCNAGSAPCNVSVTVPAATVTGAQSCAASGGTPTVTPTSWSELGVACNGETTVTTGCTGGSVCAPKPPSPFESGLCIEQTGVVTCPAGAFSTQHVFYTGVTDGRGCGACSCGAASGATCSADVTLYSAGTINTCTGAVATVQTGGCANLSGNPTVAGREASNITAPSGGSCAASGGAPTGAATPNTPTTFCCIP
jgi:hypothetical protein